MPRLAAAWGGARAANLPRCARNRWDLANVGALDLLFVDDDGDGGDDDDDADDDAGGGGGGGGGGDYYYYGLLLASPCLIYIYILSLYINVVIMHHDENKDE